MSEWKECKLGEIVDVIDSLHQTPKYSNIGYPMVRVTLFFRVKVKPSNRIQSYPF
jgi:type I restriction enzyme S subunit